MKYPASVWLDYFEDLPVQKAVSLMSQAGFAHGELSVVHLTQMKESADFLGAARELRSFADSLGYAIPQGHLSFQGGMCDDSVLERLKPEIEAFEILGIRKAILHANGGEQLSDAQRYEKWVHYATALSELAEGTGVTLCIENLYSQPQCRTVDQILSIIRDSGGKNLAVCLDIGHLHLSDRQKLVSQSPSEFIRKAGSLLQALHVTDNDGLGDTHQMPYSARYGVDWKAVMQSLQAVDYKGLFNLESLAERNAPMPIKLAKLEYMRKMCQYMLSDAFLAE